MSSHSSSAYVRVKLLVAPAAAAAAAGGVPSYLVRKLEVPRALPLHKLHAKLVALYGMSANCMLQLAVDVVSMEDAAVDSSAKVADLLWEQLDATDSVEWARGRDKLLMRLSPAPARAHASVSTGLPIIPTRAFDKKASMQPVIPKKPAGPWPRFQPAPGSLPLIVLSNEEHEWEVLDDAEFGRMESERNAGCKKTTKVAAAASSNPKAPVSEVLSASGKPNKAIPPELLAMLSGGSASAVSADPPPAPSTASITFSVNGQMYTINNPSPTVKLVNYLRYDLNTTGPKIGCSEGGCGACTVYLSKQDPTTGQLVQFSTKACLHLLASIDGWSVTTVEGLVTVKDGVETLHPIQQSMVNNWGTQCGYCTSGFVMSMYGLLQETPKPTAQQVEDRFDGNLCRCTGYRPIFKAMRAVVPGLAEEEVVKTHLASKGECKCGSGGCGSSSASSSPKKLTPCGKGEGTSCSSDAKAACHAVGIGCGFKKPGRNANACADVEDLVLYDAANPTHNINPFPRALVEHQLKQAKLMASGAPRPLRWASDTGSIWIEPQSVQDVYNILAYYAGKEVVKLVVGNSSIGVEKYYPVNPAYDHPTVLVPIGGLSMLNEINPAPDALYVGAAITLTNLIATLQSTAASLPPAQTASWTPIIRHLNMVANTGVRNVASWAGNLMLCKTHPQFPSDLMTVFSALGAYVQLISGSHGTRAVAVAAFGTTDLYADELIQLIRIPYTPANYVFDSFKVRSRHQNAHAIINAAYSLTFTGNKGPNGLPVIESASAAVGGLTQDGVFLCPKTCSSLTGMELMADNMTAAIGVLDSEAVAVGRLDPNSTYFISDPAYRHSLVLTTFFKFFAQQLAAAGVNIPPRVQSAYEVYVRAVSDGSEVFTPNDKEKPVGQPIPKIESVAQTTGAAKFIDDMPLPANGLWAAYVYSTVGCATLAGFDASAALASPGVVKFITAADIATVGGANDCGTFPGDEEIFASTSVTASGQALGMILADTREHAEVAARLVVVKYTDVKKPIVTIDDAVAANSFFPDNKYVQNPPPITCGDFASAYAAAPHKLQGTNYTGGQAHFFMETQTCYVIPGEDDSLLVNSSSQGPADIRSMVIHVTGLPAHKVVVSTPRAGGGYGGKLTRSHPIASATALAARIMRRPIKSQCSRETDMDAWGKRARMRMDYEVGFDDNGKILALQVVFYQLGGHTYEANFGCMSMCLMWSDSAYYIPNFTVSGKTCRTNTPSNTAMRGPGAFKSIYHQEAIMEVVAAALNMTPDAVRLANFYQENQLAPYGQPMTNITIKNVWTMLQQQANYTAAKASADAFNNANKWRKRGVHCTALKYGISVPGNQVGILLNVMSDDGTILVSHTGVELGQGINTKVAQTIALELGIDMSLIRVQQSATNIVANGSQTGGSATSESACAAAILACADLNNRLADLKAKNPGASWPALIGMAAGAMINLTVNAQYFVAPDNPNYPFTYFVWAASCSQVELDVLTGEVEVLRTDIVYDCGDSLNPAVDIGQIEGAFIIGLGSYLTEDVIQDEASARLLTRGTWDYHPPSSQDIPVSLNVTLLPNATNMAAQTVLGSKASAEPPMMLSCSVFFAVKDCIAAVRADQGLTGDFALPTPASTSAVQLACNITPKDLNLSP